MSFPRRGELYWVNLDPTIGSEIAKTRPAVIVSNDMATNMLTVSLSRPSRRATRRRCIHLRYC